MIPNLLPPQVVQGKVGCHCCSMLLDSGADITGKILLYQFEKRSRERYKYRTLGVQKSVKNYSKTVFVARNL